MKNSILITGATGNVGGKLVPQILEDIPDARIILLVRGKSKAQASDRVFQAILKLTPSADPERLRSRCEAVCGDITEPRLGQEADEYDRLAGTITHIIHSAAATKFRMAPDAARSVNCEGTRHVVELAMRAGELGHPVKFAHISTAFACGNRGGQIRETAFEETPRFSNIYEQTKWETERYLHRLERKFPLVIFRPSIIIGDSVTGRINDFNVLYAPLRLILTGHVHVLPCPSSTPLDVVPLDYVAQSITRIFFGSGFEDRRIYHIVAGSGNEVSVGEIVEQAMDFMAKHCPESPSTGVRYLPAGLLRIGLSGLFKKADRIMSITRAYLPYLMTVRHFDDANTRAALDDTVTPPRFDDYFANVMAYFLREELRKRLKTAA